ncbi:DUF2271 domain-containing protein [Sphingobium chlorophenolicum]|uniref:DUF2271 domain-containing protein n=1 Tax=Sphingobium chlorophenolicum TaxID=46429 RepID=A0A081RFG0_SPHCR|nr:DUF2271 domain-containing protein [Sphingobium chlorophenolicum]KEQ53933.1 hypothetical protein BV95_01805 [Sphingobium chlorophenolicum]
MQISHKIVLTGSVLGAATALAAPATAQTLDVTLTLPRLSVAEYHRPYVAVWLEKEGAPARTLSVLYDVDKRNNGGVKWLRDIRMWWRASGRSLTLPADGISGATRAPGTHKLSFAVGTLAPGKYTVAVEAARENGGREVVRVPLNVTAAGGKGSATGQFELGAVSAVLAR